MYITTDKTDPSAGSPRVPETMGRALDEAAKALARAVFGDRPRRNGFKRDGPSARDERPGRPRLGWNIPKGVRRSARGPSRVLATGIGRLPVDRVRLAPRDEPPPRPRRLREPDRRAGPRESEPDPLGRARHGPRGRRPPRVDLLGQRGADRRANAHRTEDRGPPPVPLGRPDRFLALRAPGRGGDRHAGVVLGVPDRARRFPDEVPPGPPRHVPDLWSVDRRRGRVRGGPRAPRDRPSNGPGGRLGPRVAGLRVDPGGGNLPRGHRVHRPLVPVRPRGEPSGGQLQRLAGRKGDRGPERLPLRVRVEPGPRTEDPGRADEGSLGAGRGRRAATGPLPSP